MTHFLLKVEQLRWRKRVEEFNLESEWRQSHGKHGPSKVTYTFKTNSASDHSVHPYSNQWRSNTEKTAVPWNHASTYCNTNADKKGDTPSPCQSSHFCCTWWKQLPSVRRREEKIQLKLNVTRSVQLMPTYEKPPGSVTLWWAKGIQAWVSCSQLDFCLMLQWMLEPRKTLQQRTLASFLLPEWKQKEEEELKPAHNSASKNGIKAQNKKGDKWRKWRDGWGSLILQPAFC